MSVRDSINIGGGRPHYIRNQAQLFRSLRIPNAEDAYTAVAYISGISLPEFPVPYFAGFLPPRRPCLFPVPISLYAKIGSG